jgi:gamma-glutamyltranspeptidase
VSVNYRGYEVYKNPSSSQGPAELFLLQQFPACGSFLRNGPVLISHFANSSRIMLL